MIREKLFSYKKVLFLYCITNKQPFFCSSQEEEDQAEESSNETSKAGMTKAEISLTAVAAISIAAIVSLSVFSYKNIRAIKKDLELLQKEEKKQNSDISDLTVQISSVLDSILYKNKNKHYILVRHPSDDPSRRDIIIVGE